MAGCWSFVDLGYFQALTSNTLHILARMRAGDNKQVCYEAATAPDIQELKKRQHPTIGKTNVFLWLSLPILPCTLHCKKSQCNHGRVISLLWASISFMANRSWVCRSKFQIQASQHFKHLAPASVCCWDIEFVFLNWCYAWPNNRRQFNFTSFISDSRGI